MAAETSTAGFSTSWDSFPTELLDPAEMGRADTLAAETISSFALMQRAGDAVAAAACALLPDAPGRRVVVLCGPGNNGGDGYVAARKLAESGIVVDVAALGERAGLEGDAATAAAAWPGAVTTLDAAPVEAADLVIDALFGAGLSRDIDGKAAAVVARVNDWAAATGRPVLAVDVPSGLDGATGAIRGTAIRATETISFFRLKPGHVLMPGRPLCGRLTLADIGIEARVLDAIAPKMRLNVPSLWARAYPLPSLSGHKYGRGHALVVSGSIAHTGAARLCARGALRAGAGLVTIATPSDALAVHAAALTAIMTRVVDGADALRDLLRDPRLSVVALGPGLGVGAATRALVLASLGPAPEGATRSLVLDADALSSFADDPPALFQVIRGSGHHVVLTPHDGEFAKLFGPVLDVSQPKPQRSRQAAAQSGAIVVLKGPDTVVAHPDGRAAIAAGDAPWLATAGSGDVLGGIIAGLLAQGMPAFEAAAAAVWLHAEAARRHGPCLISEDIPEALPSVVSNLLNEGLIAPT